MPNSSRHRASRASLDPSLFEREQPEIAAVLDQHDTPQWAAELIVAQKMGHLKPGDLVLEPGCGEGRFLTALPPGVRGLGIELDPRRAAIARAVSGHDVIVGDLRHVTLPKHIDAAVGNIPWDTEILDILLARIRWILPEGGKAGFVLPAWSFQNEKRVLRYNEHWSIECEAMPRRLFEGLRHPVIFATFSKNRERKLIGFFLYGDLAAVQALPEKYRKLMNETSRSVWYAVIAAALEELGGSGSLNQIYRIVEGHRPTPTQFWRDQIRKVLQMRCKRIGPGTYALREQIAS
jgi:site-specific DNA-methyltransferase (adenine-specific)